MNKWIFKILRQAEWLAAQNDSCFTGAPIDVADGFIHFSTMEQVQETADKHFKDAEQVYVCAFNTSAWPQDVLKWETSRGGALFPHLYTSLDVSLSHKEWSFSRPNSGSFDLTIIREWTQSHD